MKKKLIASALALSATTLIAATTLHHHNTDNQKESIKTEISRATSKNIKTSTTTTTTTQNSTTTTQTTALEPTTENSTTILQETQEQSQVNYEQNTSEETNVYRINHQETPTASQAQAYTGPTATIQGYTVPVIYTEQYEGYDHSDTAYRYTPLENYYAFEQAAYIGQLIRTLQVGDTVVLEGRTLTIQHIEVMPYEHGLPYYSNTKYAHPNATFLQTCESPFSWAVIRTLVAW